MKTTWVLVANSTRARILKADSAIGPLHEVEALVHPQGRLHERELTSDLPGRAFDSAGQGRHAMEQPVDPKQQEMIAFARFLAQRLDEARDKGEFKQLIIVAAPTLLGRLRKDLSPETAGRVSYELDKNISLLRPEEIRQRLPERLPSLGV
jgi:protein required for attachment to host cells